MTSYIAEKSGVFDVLGVKVSATNLSQASETIQRWVDGREKTYVCVCPVSTVVDSLKNDHYKNIINNAGMVTPDGMPLVWLANLSGEKKVQRTYGPDLLMKVCEDTAYKGYKHFFYGGSERSLTKLMAVLKQHFPELNIVGSYSPSFIGINEDEKEDVIHRINTLNSDIIWVGLGSPKQDYWMAQHRSKLEAPVLIGVGAAFDFLSGTKKQAPLWMQKSGLEWFFRLCSEPKRLWQRYLIGNTLFIYFLTKDFFKKIFLRTPSS